jgi:excinuclease ABC subunit A
MLFWEFLHSGHRAAYKQRRKKKYCGTVTEIYHFLRLLFVKLGVQHCPDCNIPITSQSTDEIIADTMKRYQGQTISVFAPLIINRKGSYYDLAHWAYSQGYYKLRTDGKIHWIDQFPQIERYKEHRIEIVMGDIVVNPENEKEIREMLEKAFYFGKETAYIETKKSSRIVSKSRSFQSAEEVLMKPDPRLFSFNSRHGWCPNCFGTGLEISGFDENQTGEEIMWNEWWGGDERTCRLCNGKRLKKEALSVFLYGKSIDEYTALSIKDAHAMFRSFRLKGRDSLIATSIIAELLSRLQFLEHVGLDYLTLDRAATNSERG